jgi:membrane protein DedA with SNARE-associated domain
MYDSFMDYSAGIRFAIGVGCISLLVGYGIGFWNGCVVGRKREYRAWSNDVYPMLKRLERERDALWRSSVSKTQKLNRIMRDTGRL